MSSQSLPCQMPRPTPQHETQYFCGYVQINGLVVNCSAFNPTPSLSAAVVNKFKFKRGIRTFNLSGMGCAASIIGVDLAMEILAVSPWVALHQHCFTSCITFEQDC